MHQCDFPGCEATFTKLWRLNEHRCSAHTGERPHVCPHPGCDKAFIRAYHLKRHVLTHSVSKDEHQCPQPGCSRVYGSLQSLRKHVKTHSDPSPHKCDECKASFKKHTQLAIHRAEHSGTLPFQCPSEGCLAAFPTPSDLRRHQKTHEGYRCPEEECGAVFTKWTELMTHALTHPKVCKVCQESFSRNRQLRLHMAAVHSPSREVFACPDEECERVYTTQYNLQQHISAFHKKERLFRCSHSECEARFSTKQSLQRHVHSLHTGVKQHPKPKKKRTLISRLSGHVGRSAGQGSSLLYDGVEKMASGVNENELYTGAEVMEEVLLPEGARTVEGVGMKEGDDGKEEEGRSGREEGERERGRENTTQE